MKNLSAIGPNLSEGNPVHKSSSLQSVLSRINPAVVTVSAKTRCRSYSVPDEPSLIYNLTLSVRKERRLRLFENMVLRSIFGPKRDEVTGEWRENFTTRSLMICTALPVLFG